MTAHSWASVRNNVSFLGCYPDYALIHPEYASDEWYRTSKRHHFEPPAIKQPQTEPKLPARRTWGYMDGPARIIPCIEPWPGDERHEKLVGPTKLDQVLLRAYNLALGAGCRFFALQNGGLVMGTSSSTFLKWPKLDDSKCAQGQGPYGAKLGSVFTNSVYEILSANVIDTEPLGAFRDVTYPLPLLGSTFSCPTYPDNFFPMSPAQLFMQEYFRPDSDHVKGLLSYKSAGAGKTCEALNVMGNFMAAKGWTILWITRTSLRATPLKNLYRDICQLQLRKLIDAPEPLTLASGEVLARTPKEKIAFIRSDRGPAVLKRYGIELEKQRIMSYDDFVRMLLGKGANGKKLLEQQGHGAHGDPLRKCLIVIDEAQNLVSPGLPAEERKELDSGGREVIRDAIHKSYTKSKHDSCKVLLLSGTPMSTSPVELFWLLNLCIEHPKDRLSLRLDDYVDASTSRVKPDAILKFARACHGRVSYLDISKNPTTFSRKLYAGSIDAVAQPWHLEKLAKGAKGAQSISSHRDMELAAQVKGSFYNPSQLRPQTEDEIREERRLEYYRGLAKARAAFGFDGTKKQRDEYHKLQKRYEAWIDGRAEAPERVMARDGSLLREEEVVPLPLPLQPWLTSEHKLMSLDAWLAKIRSGKVRPDRPMNKRQLALSKYVIRDPGTGFMRLRTEDEFAATATLPKLDKPTLSTSMLMWHKAFKPQLVVDLMPYYMPKIHNCIENIISLEAEKAGKHTVFTFTTAGKGAANGYGARIVASAFHAHPKFKVCLVYDVNADGEFVLRYDVPVAANDPDGPWGVAILSSAPIPNVYHSKHGGNKTVEYNAKIVKATQEAFNSAENRTGRHIKVLIMDGAYAEGVEAYDDTAAHFLDRGISKSQLEQASSRSVRYCRSLAIPFYRGVGAFTEMYFYTLSKPDGSSLYDEMMAMVPADQHMALQLMDTFQELAKQYSIDYWLNANVNDFNPVYSGTLVGDGQVELGLITADGKHSTKVIQVRPQDIVRHGHESKVDFYIPYGVDMAQHVVGQGSAVADVSGTDAPTNIADVTLEGSLDIITGHFSNNGPVQPYRTTKQFVLLGLIAMIRSLISGNTPDGTDIHVAVDGEEYSLQWTCEPTMNKRLLTGSTGLVKQWLSAKHGLSLLVLTMVGPRCTVDSTDRIAGTLTNILLYVPKWKTIERFNPRGYMPFEYDQVALDTKLHDLFASFDPSIRYMSAVETSPLRGIARLAGAGAPNDPTSAAFSLLYMHVRMLHICKTLGEGVVEEDWPIQFQRRLVEAMRANVVKHGRGGLDEYIKGYSQHVLQTRQYVLNWDGYNYDMLFNDNCLTLLKQLQTAARQPKVSKVATVAEQPNLDYLFQIEGWF